MVELQAELAQEKKKAAATEVSLTAAPAAEKTDDLSAELASAKEDVVRLQERVTALEGELTQERAKYTELQEKFAKVKNTAQKLADKLKSKEAVAKGAAANSTAPTCSRVSLSARLLESARRPT